MGINSWMINIIQRLHSISYSTSFDFPVSHRVSFDSQESSSLGTIRDTIAESCYRACPSSFRSKFLLSSLSGSKTKPEMETCYRPKHSEQFCVHSNFQYGHSGSDSQLSSTRSLGFQPRSSSCILSFTHASNLEKVSQVSVLRPDLFKFIPFFNI